MKEKKQELMVSSVTECLGEISETRLAFVIFVDLYLQMMDCNKY